MAEEVGAHLRQCPPGVRHPHIGNRGVLRLLLAQHRRRTGGHSFPDKGVAVRREAGHSHEQVAGLRGPGVIAHMRDFHLHVRRGVQDFNTLQ